MSLPSDHAVRWTRRVGIVYFLGLGALFLLALVQRAALWQVLSHPHYTNDAWGYTEAIHRWLGESGFPHHLTREFLYPYLVALCLKLGDGYRLLGLVQVALAAATPFFVMAAWSRLQPFRPAGRAQAIAQLLAGWWLAIVVLFHGGHLLETALVGPEIVFIFALAVLLWLLSLMLTAVTPPVRLIAAGFVVYVACALFFIRPHGLLVAPICLAVAAWFVWRRVRAATWPRLAAIGLPLVLVVATLVLPYRAATRPATPQQANLFLPLTLICWHAPVTEPALEAAAADFDPERAALIRKAAAAVEDSYVGGDKDSWRSYNAVWCMYFSPLADTVAQVFGGDRIAEGRFLDRLFVKAVLARPVTYARIVWLEFSTILRRPIGYETARLVIDTAPLDGITSDIPSFERMRPELARRDDFDTVASVPLGLGPPIRRLMRSGNDLFIGLLAVALVLAGLRARHDGLATAFRPLLPMLPGAFAWVGISLTCALSHSLIPSRYLDIQVPATALTEAAAIVAVVANASGRFTALRARRRNRPADPRQLRQGML